MNENDKIDNSNLSNGNCVVNNQPLQNVQSMSNMDNDVVSSQLMQNNQRVPNMNNGVVDNSQLLQSDQIVNAAVVNIDNESLQSSSNKLPKKNNLFLIIGGISIFVIAAICVCFLVFFSGNDKKKASSNTDNDIDSVNNIKNGSAELVFTSSSRITEVEHIDAHNYFETKQDNKEIILDTKGNVVLTVNDSYKYLGDNYFLYSDDENLNVFDAQKKKKIFSFKDHPLGNDLFSVEYDNGVLYYNDIDDNYVFVAYDLINNKELWRVKGANSIKDLSSEKIIGLNGNYIYLNSNNYKSITEFGEELVPSIVVDLDGNVIVEGNTDQYSNYYLDKNNLVHTFVMKNHYLKVKFGEYVEVYNFKHNKISTISLKQNDNTKYLLASVFNNDMFSILEMSRNIGGVDKHILYDVNGNIVLEGKVDFDYAKDANNSKLYSSKLTALKSGDLFLIKDNKVIKTISNFDIKEDSGLISNEKFFLIIKNYDSVNMKFSKQIMNLRNQKVIDSPLENLSDSVNESLYGGYVILSTGNDFYVYDEEFNLKYESTNPLVSINDEYVLEHSLDDYKMYIVNIETGRRNELDVKGKYAYQISASAVVTSDDANYYLYAFN